MRGLHIAGISEDMPDLVWILSLQRRCNEVNQSRRPLWVYRFFVARQSSHDKTQNAPAPAAMIANRISRALTRRRRSRA